MTGLHLALAESSLVALLLSVARVAGFVTVCPPFNSRGVPMQARVVLVIALSLPLSASMRTGPAAALDSFTLLPLAVLQLVTGLTLGFLVQVAVSAIHTVGDLIDTVGGFSVSLALDPLLLVQTSVMGRLHQLLAAVLLFVTDGHLMILQGLSRSVAAMPEPSASWHQIASALTAQVASAFAAAVQIAAPLIAAMLVADICLGLLTRAAPALNAFTLGYPLKIFFTLILAGLVITRLPEGLRTLVRDAVLHGMAIFGGAAGGG